MSKWPGTQGGGLPLPSVSPAVRFRSRPTLRLAVVCALAALTFYGSYTLTASRRSLSTPLTPLIPPARVARPRPSNQSGLVYPSDSTTANPDALPILWPDDYPPLRSVPADLDDPWPARPEIVNEYLNPDRELVDPPLPKYPAHDELPSIPLSPDHKIPFDRLHVPDGWSDETSPGKLGDRRKMNRVQAAASVFDSHGDEAREEEARRREWVRRAMIHGWDAYKSVVLTYRTYGAL
jgi:hypothetical protein